MPETGLKKLWENTYMYSGYAQPTLVFVLIELIVEQDLAMSKTYLLFNIVFTN